jgi:ATP-dependent Clp protease ATP-binding subunit ClpA
MALAFGNTKGTAIKNKVDAYEYKDGENTVRLVGGVLPRYVYWIKGTNDKDIPVECLAFDREMEKFVNKEVDHVPTYFPERKCSWAYSINCIDPKDGKVKVLNLKKKLFEQIINAAADLGDPTDPDTGWDVVFKRAKTGPLPFNVEYTLQVLRCKKRALTDDERKLVEESESIDAKYPRPTADDIKALLEKITGGTTEEMTESEKEAIGDIPQ